MHVYFCGYMMQFEQNEMISKTTCFGYGVLADSIACRSNFSNRRSMQNREIDHGHRSDHGGSLSRQYVTKIPSSEWVENDFAHPAPISSFTSTALVQVLTVVLIA